MKLRSTDLSRVVVVEGVSSTDHRGAFSRLYCERELAAAIGDRHIVQINHSRTTAVGAVRGLHAQSGAHAEVKLVRCLRGAVWDVAVDLRRNSPTFLQWHAEELSAGNGRMMIIPEGCAHGFQVLEPDSELLYLHTEFYAPDCEIGVRADDPRFAISWPLAISDLSKRDLGHPLLADSFQGWDTPSARVQTQSDDLAS